MGNESHVCTMNLEGQVNDRSRVLQPFISSKTTHEFGEFSGCSDHHSSMCSRMVDSLN